MMKKLLVGFVAVLLATSLSGGAKASTIVLHSTGQLGGITEVDINGTLWDATFYNQWQFSGMQIYNYNWAQDATQALSGLFDTVQFDYYDLNADRIWGSELSPAFLLTPFFASNAFNPDYWTVRGAIFSNSSGLGVDQIIADSNYLQLGSVANGLDQTPNHSFIQWTLSNIEEDDTPPPPPAPVPEPSTFLLFGGGLVGLAFYTRKRRKE